MIFALVKTFDKDKERLYLKVSRLYPMFKLPFPGTEGYVLLNEWPKLEMELKKALVSISYERGLKEQIVEYGLKKVANAHAYKLVIFAQKEVGLKYDVSLVKNVIRIKLLNDARYSYVGYISGAVFNSDKKWVEIPKAEGYKLFENLMNVDGVRYSDEAKDYIAKQIERRANIDKIALATDWDFDVELGGGVKLRPFQRIGAGFIDATDGRALLAYEMGLGKTVISLAYAIKYGLRTLIVCPASLKANWTREIRKLSKKDLTVYSGREPSSFDLFTLIKGDNQFHLINYDIIGGSFDHKRITQDTEGFDHEKYEKFYPWVKAINLANFDLVIFDESHYGKNSGSQRSQGMRQIKAKKIVHMTGTPVLNRPGELWPILTMLAPDQFPSEELFIRQYTYDGKKARNVGMLQESLKSIMIRRKQSDVVADLPPLNRIEDYHELSPRAKKLYNKILDGIFEKVGLLYVDGTRRDETAVTSILAQIMRLKQVCAIDKIESTADLATELHLSMEGSGSPHNKVLIFSQFKATAYAIYQRLGHEALCFVRAGASEFETVDNSERDKLVQQFQNDDSIKYLVVTEKTAKEGHNITKAGAVIFNDLFWTPAAHQQCEGRAYMRVSDPHGINSYYRIVSAENSNAEIEEWIYDLLHEKMEIIESTVEGVESARSSDESIAKALIEKIRNHIPNYKYK